MEDSVLQAEHRAVFLGEVNEYAGEVISGIKNELAVEFVYVDSEEELIERCYSYEPTLILTELTPKHAAILMKAARIKKYRHSITVGLVSEGSEIGARLVNEGIITDTVPLTGNAVLDSCEIIRSLKNNIRFGINIRTIAGSMPIVTENTWHDISWDSRYLRASVSSRLDRLGVRKELAGHKYLIAAIVLQSSLVSVPQPIKLYESIASYYETNAANVERAIRYAIETAWTVGDIDYQHAVFGMSIDEDKGKPTNAEFIARLALDY